MVFLRKWHLSKETPQWKVGSKFCGNLGKSFKIRSNSKYEVLMVEVCLICTWNSNEPVLCEADEHCEVREVSRTNYIGPWRSWLGLSFVLRVKERHWSICDLFDLCFKRKRGSREVRWKQGDYSGSTAIIHLEGYSCLDHSGGIGAGEILGLVVKCERKKAVMDNYKDFWSWKLY